MLSGLFKERTLHKYYLCIVKGVIKEEQDVRGWLLKNEKTNQVRIFKNETKDARPIHTKYRPLADNGQETLLEIELLTGRTHQIRAHLAHIGTPILGDTKYGNMRENRDRHCKYQLLWAYQITLEPYPDTCLSDLNGMTIRTAVPSFVTKEFPTVSI